MNTHENDTEQILVMTKTVLIVEDNALNMRLFDGVLRANGYKTLKSEDGGDVLEIVKKHSPDLIIMDIQLPIRSGLDITKDLKADEAFKNIPIIVVTAFAMKGDEEKIRESGCDDYMAKPINIPAFLGMVTKHLS